MILLVALTCHAIMWVCIAPFCIRVIYLFPVIVCVSVDSGVEVPPQYLDDPRNQHYQRKN